MEPRKRLFAILGVILFSSLLLNCSSSSQSQRYNRGEDADVDPQRKSARFTSADDEETHAEATARERESETETTYRNYTPEFDEEFEEEYPVDAKEFSENYGKLRSLSIELTNREKVIFEVIGYLDTPYQFGGNSKNGIDCSAFTQQVLQKSVAYKLPRTASQQYQLGEKIDSKSGLQFGDLVFFNTTKRAYPGHVGIYLGDHLFAHASRSKGVVVSSLKNSYYLQRFVGGRRVQQFTD